MKKSPREAAYDAVLSSTNQRTFAQETLDRWIAKESPSKRDEALAREIAYGTIRMGLALDHCARQLSPQGRLKAKAKERVLLRTALYQHIYMDRIPVYAIVDETIRLAKRHCGPFFTKFLNASLRKMEGFDFQLPSDNSAQSLSIRLSYPLKLVEDLIRDYGVDKSIRILELGNTASQLSVRLRDGDRPEYLEVLHEKPFPMAKLLDATYLSEIATKPSFYIQNLTPAHLIGTLCSQVERIEKVLDLCASPGGKTLAVHDCFPDARLFANDVSEEKLFRLRENFEKYQIPVTLHCGDGQAYPEKELMDVVIIDAPCSNTGVLSKRPEARWRYSLEAVQQTAELQKGLIRHASKLIKERGEIWYMTCSIMKSENEKLVDEICKELDLKIKDSPIHILPTEDGWDGGFACSLIR